ELEPDVIGLQEVILAGERSQADYIGEGFGYHAAFGAANDLGGGVYFGNAALSKSPITAPRVYALPACDNDENRAMPLCKIDSPYGKIPFFGTHLNWKFHEGYVREAQVQTIAEHIKKDAPISGLPPILVGDLNAQPEATEIRFLKGLHALGGKSFFMD